MFLYFVPGRNTLGRHELAALGLAYLLEPGANFSTRGVPGGGPGGQSGVVFASVPPEETGHVKIDLAGQVWRQIPGSEAWVGHYTDRLPTPEQLARHEQVAGEGLELSDGNIWQVPVARSWTRNDAGEDRWRVRLPRKLELNADGVWANGNVLPRLQPLWEVAQAWIGARTGRKESRFAGSGDIEAAILALQTNYKVGPVEVSLLGILREDLILRILDCLIDWSGWEEYLKKNGTPAERSTSPNSTASDSPTTLPAGSISSAGPADSTPTIAPPEPT